MIPQWEPTGSTMSVLHLSALKFLTRMRAAWPLIFYIFIFIIIIYICRFQFFFFNQTLILTFSAYQAFYFFFVSMLSSGLSGTHLARTQQFLYRSFFFFFVFLSVNSSACTIQDTVGMSYSLPSSPPPPHSPPYFITLEWNNLHHDTFHLNNWVGLGCIVLWDFLGPIPLT